ncbi:MAG: hypothetical protein M1829_003094 [Trizodia sp. TS-e1964]|nr:MAG: hypothetical protein M1829_003094 [Trizodia sp. TS-e1964]
MPATTKPTLHPLQTPKTASFPSEISSPLPSGVIDLVKQEPGVKTPITPPLAYTDFLKSLSSPTGLLAKTPTSAPTSAASPSSASTTGIPAICCSCECEHHKTPKSAIPPSPLYPLSAPATATGPCYRRFRTPASPLYSPASARSATLRSPFSAIRSPADWGEWDAGKIRFLDAPLAGSTRPVSVRQVVTRTVTYKSRCNLAPAPKGKKRRLE